MARKKAIKKKKKAAPRKKTAKKKTAKKKTRRKTPIARRSTQQPRLRPTTSVPETITVTLKTSAGRVCEIESGPLMQRLAMEWNYVIRNRKRWTKRQSGRDDVARRAVEALHDLGITTDHLKKLALAGVVEVQIPYRSEEVGWEARILPWEFMLSAATRQHRGNQFMAVVRYLDCNRPPNTRDPQSLVIIEAAPGPLRDEFDFEAENSLVKASMRLETKGLQDPTPESLAQFLKELSPDVIHLTGVDVRLGEQLLTGGDDSAVNDGILLSGPRGQVQAVEAVQLAELLNRGDPPPVFIGFNCWNSGARLAPMAVAAGAGTTVGFQHTFDDSVAELFYVNFYRAFGENRWDPLSAFLQAFEAIQSFDKRIQGSVIALWSDHSLVEKTDPSRRSREEAKFQLNSRRERLTTETRMADPKLDRIRDLIDVSVVPVHQLNYSLLHNSRSVLKNLTFRFKQQHGSHGLNQPDADDADPTSHLPVGTVRDIEVEVILSVGAEAFPFRTNISIDSVEAVLDLASDEEGGVRVPLTSELARSIDERVQTSLFVQVRWHGQLLYQHTHSVYLMPVDEWKLTQEDICWLPSFVQPRDPSVGQIVAAGQRYLMCLADYAAAGFDGYQSYDGDLEDAWDGVQRQVRALWSALTFDYRLGYINPPPAYSLGTQRLRTPFQTTQQGRGTCIDLALLIASCLEWIEVYPVIFLLDAHAFPGYWKSLDAYESFCQVRQTEDPSDREPEFASRKTSSMPRFNASWIADRNSYRELKQFVDQGDLVPIESVCMTQSCGFQESIDAALEYFAKSRNRSFHSMVDIAMARSEQITPLPLCLPAESRRSDG